MKQSRPISFLAGGTLLALAFTVQTAGCGDKGSSEGSGGAGGSSASSASASPSTSGSTGSASSSTAGSSVSTSGTSSASSSTSGASTSSSSTGGSATCPGPLEFDDGDPCTFPDPACPSACGIEELGSRNCACTGGIADCDTCKPPDSTKYPLNPVAVDCSTLGGDGSTASIRNKPCTEAQEGTSCIGNDAPSARGCVCWDLGPGFQWECGSINKWFAK